MLLVENGKATSVILVSETSIKQGFFAAEELQKYLEKASRALIPIASASDRELGNKIIVGTIDDLEKDPHLDIAIDKSRLAPSEAFAIRSHQETGTLALIGGGRLGALYAVYSFLEEHIGVGWCGIGPDGETIPEKRTIEIDDISQYEEPAFKYRGKTIGSVEDELGRIDWMAKNRMNLVFTDLQGWKTFKEKAILEVKTKRGMILDVGGHSFGYWLPPEKYFKDHPEYFALIDGRRIGPEEKGGRPQICMSNPEVAQIVAHNIIEFIKENPEVDIIGLWPNDTGKWCQCNNCRAIEPERRVPIDSGVPVETEAYLKFVNAVTEKVAKVYPEKMIDCIAYRGTIEPPREVSFKVHKNIFLTIAPIERLYGSSLSGFFEDVEDDAVKNYLYFRDALKKWRETVEGDVCMYEYYMGRDASLSMPFPIAKVIMNDARFFRHIGINGLYMQSRNTNFNAYGLNYFAAARHLWNPETEYEEVLDHYCRRYYGHAHKAMKEYYDLLETESRKESSFSPSIGSIIKILTPAVTEKCLECLEEAARSADNEQILRRIDYMKIIFDYAENIKKLMHKSMGFGSLLEKNDLGGAYEEWIKEVTRDEGGRLVQELTKVVEANDAKRLFQVTMSRKKKGTVSFLDYLEAWMMACRPSKLKT